MGTVRHTHDWDNRWNAWHLARPVLGAVTGSVAFAFVVVVIKTAAGPSAEVQDSSSAIATAAAIAFLVGYKEQHFLDLLARVAEVLLANGEVDQAGDPFTVSPTSLDFGSVVTGTARVRTVQVTVAPGRTIEALTDADLDVQPADGVFTAAPVPAPAALGATSQAVSVTFAPTGTGTRTATLTIRGDASRTVQLSGSGAQ